VTDHQLFLSSLYPEHITRFYSDSNRYAVSPTCVAVGRSLMVRFGLRFDDQVSGLSIDSIDSLDQVSGPQVQQLAQIFTISITAVCRFVHLGPDHYGRTSVGF
jgi:hypothetical protein